MSQHIDFNNWVIADSEGVLLRVVRRMTPVLCDACASASAEYDVCFREDGGGQSTSCQGCLEMSYEDPQSPDEWFAPVRKGTRPVNYSDGGQQVVAVLR